jgi:hypothetical protein
MSFLLGPAVAASGFTVNGFAGKAKPAVEPKASNLNEKSNDFEGYTE